MPPPSCGLGPGDVLARRYRLETPLGWGGLAVVFQAVDIRPRRRKHDPAVLAVKVMRTDLAPDERQDAQTVFRWEAHLLRRLRHPAVPRLGHLHSDQTGTWIARELMVGTPLSAWTARAPCDPEMVRGWALQVCDVLSYLHTRAPAIICADLKPANLIQRPDGALALIDLGAAHTRTRQPPRRARPRYGTPGYAPPEQLGNWGIDERSDLFSLGVICYELLTGIDPTSAPLQFDLELIDRVAPALALPLRWALALEQAQRVPTAAVLRAALGGQQPTEPLQVGYGIRVNSQHELMQVAMRHPHLLERTLQQGALDSWLLAHPEPALGTLLHNLRSARHTAPPRQSPVDTFFAALAPSEGSPMLQAMPATIRFGRIPLRRWKVWSQPRPLSLYNAARHPLRWELECPAHASADVRILAEDRTLRRLQGVLPPGGRIELPLVAVGRKGPRQGTLTLRCGVHITHIPWEASASAGVPVGQQFAERLEDLDCSQAVLVPALEALLQDDVLSRWLRSQGKRKQAAELAHAASDPALSPLQRRLLIMHMLHPLHPRRFPLLQVDEHPPEPLRLAAGSSARHGLIISNLGSSPCLLAFQSRCSWASLGSTEATIAPGSRITCLVKLAPPAGLAAGSQHVALELRVGDLLLPVSIPVEITSESWYQRLWQWFFGH